MRVLVTGSAGFVGKNLVQTLLRRSGVEVFEYDVGMPDRGFLEALGQADAVVHLAGVNRPQAAEEFETGNAGSTRQLCERLMALGRAPQILFASSIQAELDNPYGISKRRAEEALRRFSEATGARVTVYRWPNLFGKWCRPNYNSVVATFCHNIARGLPVLISDSGKEIELAYIDDVVAAIVGELENTEGAECFRFAQVQPTYRVTLGALAESIRAFRESRSTLLLADFGDRFTRCLYATYLSYLPEAEFSYSLDIKRDSRGELAEFLKSPFGGQIFVSRTRPGVTRGNHFHHTKVEKFLVLEGEAVIRFRHIVTDELLTYPVTGKEFRVVDIPPGYTHSIENVGAGEMVVLFWVSEVFDPKAPDTFAAEVLRG
jgi:UDP-2-acetamido-2,6-beta-L-arabino-hexul-4-ose reductase